MLQSVHVDLVHTVHLTSHGKLQAGSGLDFAVVVWPVDQNKTEGQESQSACPTFIQSIFPFNV